MGKYDPPVTEPKWQKVWEERQFYQAVDPPSARGGFNVGSEKPKKYILVEFPYPSGERLHVGHARTYCALDAVSRKYRMEGFNVLFPFGWDAFGLPAENYALKTGVHPFVTTSKNIAAAKAQAKRWGLSFDWGREINTTDPSYYKWTQWIFLKLLEKGLAYQAEVPVNWCPKCKSNLANEEVLANGTHERCGELTERRLQRQWLLRITAYADRLLEDLKLVDYLPKIRIQQENWIGRSEGVEIKFKVHPPAGGSKFKVKEEFISVFTTRPDTLFGVTFFVLAPEHEMVKKLITPQQKRKVEKYLKEVCQKSELERISEMKEKTGVFSGSYVLNPLSNEKIPVFVADFVLTSYGTGAVMGVPGHDQRDWDFAKKYGLEIREVIAGGDVNKGAYTGDGKLVNSGKYNGLQSSETIAEITKDLEEDGLAEKDVQYHLRDWVFSRQHYWGEPIPIIHCEKCGVVPVPEHDLPVELPFVEKYEPTGTGESPLAAVSEWVNVSCPKCQKAARRETDTMPNWAGSNWYFLRYCDPNNAFEFANFEKLQYFLPVDLYNGGMEHTTLHLLYSRFIHKFLYDCGLVPTSEPYAKRTSHGVVLGPDGQRMSKSRGNVVNPDEIVENFGADTFRVYEAFMGPFDQTVVWDKKGVEGCYRFLGRVWRLIHRSGKTQIETQKDADSVRVNPRLDPRNSASNKRNEDRLTRELHRLIKKVTEDLDSMKFNTAIAAMMGFLNEVQTRINTDKALPAVKDADCHGLSSEDWGIFLRLLAPFAPHITEELWQKLRNGETKKRSNKKTVLRSFGSSVSWSIHQQPWPKYDPKLTEEEEVTIVVQVNGKVREKVEVESQKSKVKSRKS